MRAQEQYRARANLLPHEDARYQELRQDVRDLADNDLPHLTPRRRNEYLEELWSGIHQDPRNQFQHEYMNMMRQRVGSHLTVFDNLNQLEHPAIPRIINTNIRHPIGWIRMKNL
jgi:hypothetical protein